MLLVGSMGNGRSEFEPLRFLILSSEGWHGVWVLSRPSYRCILVAREENKQIFRILLILAYIGSCLHP